MFMQIDDVSAKILRELCMNSRCTINEVAEKVGLSRETVRARIKKLEEELGLWYTVELDESIAGLDFQCLVAVELKNRSDPKKIRRLLSKSKIPQFAAICEGKFDLFIYAVAPGRKEYLKWEYGVRSALEDELIAWKASQISLKRYGFFPVDTRVFDSLKLPDEEKKILKVLSIDSRLSIDEVAKRAEMKTSLVRYHVERMIKNKVIRRFTAIVKKPTERTHLLNFLEFTYGKKHEETSVKVRELMDKARENDPFDSHPAIIEISGAYDAFDWITMPTTIGAYEHIKKIERMFSGSMNARSAILTTVILGVIPTRNMSFTEAYEQTRWDSEENER